LSEIVSPIVNPKYVLVRRNSLPFFSKQKDYHAVPDILGKNKTLANIFAKNWRTHVGSTDLIYTRTIAGRERLIKLRMETLSNKLEDESPTTQNAWR